MTDFDRDETTDLIEFEDAEPTHVDDLAELPMAELLTLAPLVPQEAA